MGNSLSEEQCDNRCDKEMRPYQEMERILREKMNKMEDDLDEKDDECKKKLNDFEADLKKQFNSAGNSERIIQEWISNLKENPKKHSGVCDDLCSTLKINGNVLNNSVAINSVVAVDNIDNFKPPSSVDIERYKFINRLKECKKISDMNQKKLCYQRIEGIKNSILNEFLMGNTKPINLNIINNGNTSDLVETLKECNSKSEFVKGFCIKNRLEKKTIPNIEYSRAYIDKYINLFEGFENNEEVYEGINVSTLLLLLLVTVIILKFCD